MARTTILLVGVLLASGSLARAGEKQQLGKKAGEILRTHCYRCHGEKGAVEGGLNYLLDAARLSARNIVVPGKPGESKLIQRIQNGEMPPQEEKYRPSAAELALLQDWVNAGAQPFQPLEEKRKLITPAAMVNAIWKDLGQLPEFDRPFTRFFTLTHFYNAGYCEDELETYRQALSKLINSLSWGPRVVAPVPIDAKRTILRIDLRKYDWSKQTWLQAAGSPYRLPAGTDAEQHCQDATQAPVFHARADWFVAKASTDPLYHTLMQIPYKLEDLEKKLRVDVVRNFNSGLAVRAGFNNSLVSPAHRLIERHETLYGAYWLTYELNAGDDLFKQPWVNPSRGKINWGNVNEAMFHLPNGMLAYFTIQRDGKRGQFSRMDDPRGSRPGQTVHIKPALSCMSCHTNGIIAKDDMVRAQLDAKPEAYAKNVLERVRQLHPPREKLQALMEEDADRFREAVKQAGCQPGSAEPIAALALLHEGTLDLNLAAAELGLLADVLRERLQKTDKLHRFLIPLLEEGGTIQRIPFASGFSRFVKGELAETDIPHLFTSTGVYPELLLPARGKHLPPRMAPLTNLLPTPRATVLPDVLKVTIVDDHLVCEFEDHKEPLEAVALSPRERLVASESKSGTIKLYDPISGEQRLSLRAHTRGVTAMEFSADGTLLATGSHDKSARIWNVSSGQLVKSFSHTQPVTAVRMSPNGQWLAVVAQQPYLWDVRTGKKAPVAFPKTTEAINGLAFSPDSKTLAVTGKAIHLWDTAKGKEKAVLRGHKGFAHAVAFSPDGKLLASGGSDRTIILWDAASQEQKKVLKGHLATVTSLVFTPDGKQLVSGSGSGRLGFSGQGEVKVWKLDEEPLATTLLGLRQGVTGVAIGGGGKLVAASSHDRAVHLWTLDRSAPLLPSRPEPRPFEGHEGPIFAMFLSQDGKHILTGGDDNTVRLWDAATGEELLVLLGHDKNVRHVALAPDGKTAYSCGMDQVLRVWDLKKGVQARQIALPEKTHATAFSRDGKTLAVGLMSAETTGSVQLLDPTSGKKLRELGTTPSVPSYLALSADDRWLVGVDQKLAFRVWDVDTGKGQDLKAETGHTFQVTASAFSSDGKLLVSGSADRTICIWDLESGKEIRKIGYFPAAIQGVVFAPDGKSFFVSTGITNYAPKDAKTKQPQTPRVQSGLCTISQVDTATGKILQYWDELPGAPLRLVPLPDGRILAAFSDGLQKWTPENGKALAEN